ncbi:MAG: AAA family ATPase [Myxococcales bacterium]|nr:AAA family ATPase [Myxococcales bacterium]
MSKAAAKKGGGAPEEIVRAFREDLGRIQDEIGKVIVGQEEIVQGVITCIMADGHVLLEGVPGLGKTVLVNTISHVMDLQFERIQFTPDLQPSDIIGTRMAVEDERGSMHFEFQKGPVFTNLLLADEINRATPKTQAALLESMAERSVTVASTTHRLEPPFFVMATQNPLEQEGTYPLPEAQLDRFLFKLIVRFPSLDELDIIMDRTTRGVKVSADKVIDRERLLEMRRQVREVEIAKPVQRYALRLLRATHPDMDEATDMVRQFVRNGGSPRGAQAMLLAAKVNAMMDGRYHVGPEDIQAIMKASLRHRVILNFEGEAEGVQTDDILSEILKKTSVKG